MSYTDRVDGFSWINWFSRQIFGFLPEKAFILVVNLSQNGRKFTTRKDAFKWVEKANKHCLLQILKRRIKYIYYLEGVNNLKRKEEKKKGNSNRESGTAFRRKLNPDGMPYFPKTHSFNVRIGLRLQTNWFPENRISPVLPAQEAIMHLPPSFVLRHHLLPKKLQKDETKRERSHPSVRYKRYHLQRIQRIQTRSYDSVITY